MWKKWNPGWKISREGYIVDDNDDCIVHYSDVMIHSTRMRDAMRRWEGETEKSRCIVSWLKKMKGDWRGLGT